MPRFPIPDSRLPRCAYSRRIKFATGRTAPDSLGALTVVELNSPRVAPLPTPDSLFPVPYSLFPVPFPIFRHQI
ncbi:MAG: hypothetical protein F6K55_25615 [Moorea sp. SIO4A3]|nr:hypothetical protein [Moorena sp. SIO4A3]